MSADSHSANVSSGLPMTSAFEFPDRVVTGNLGVIYGLVVRSMGVVGGVAAGLKALRRGEVSQYTQLLEDSRRHAIDRLVDNARLVGADGVIGVRFDSSEIGQQLTEIVAYGTAVTLGPRE
ncbi:MAG TPA: heavy metal-binding domain-containing protein [Solirubrobacteraceae bacterium]|nr:heavy metal-binding domain-containing protein [Solirubrobacteraceae bacterium]